ncbi:retrovirus-related pol polyprotein from transposon TNT 1-94 [Tanacetum coccineum]
MPMSTEIKLTKNVEADFVDCTKYQGLWYSKGIGIETIVYADSDHAGDYVDRKSTSGVSTFMGCCFTSWFAKKQTAFAISMTEVEYVSAGKACQQALWMKQALIDNDIRLDDISYHSPQASTQPMTEFPQMDSGLIVPVFNPGDDPIVCLNKAMAFLTAVASSRVKVTWLGNALNQIGQGMLHDPGIPDGQAVQTTIPNTAAFQTEYLDAYDSDCNDVSNANAVLMANLSSYSDVLSEVPHSETSHNDMGNQSVHAMQDFEQTPTVNFSDNEITSDRNIISYS